MAIENKEWLTVTEAAYEIGVSAGRVRQFILSGRIRTMKLNSRMQIIARSEVERFKTMPRNPGTPGHHERISE